ncbi:MAG TPA: TIGR03084 family metal-binding protein [Acidimicrobiia bacterium]|nr:TIGR03084 family metal-binding protein [Acidimicrobiia bacterium]
MVDYPGLLADLDAEETELDAIVAGIDDDAWLAPTPAAGWDVRDSIAHLAYSEELAATALSDPEAFQERLRAMLADLRATEEGMLREGRARPGHEVLGWWRAERRRVLENLRGREPSERVAWITGPMSAVSFATARLMETWAHGQDVLEALGVSRARTARLRHVADLGVRTRPFSYAVHGRTLPDRDVRVELVGPDGDCWEWGESTTDTIRGDALDFCLVVTRRRRPAETALEVRGPLAREWIDIAQAFAGPPAT